MASGKKGSLIADSKPKTPEQIVEQLQIDLKYWQRELRIEHIDIHFRWLAKGENSNVYATTWTYPKIHFAIIAFNLPQNRNAEIDLEFNGSYEVVLVHELLHVRDSNWRSSRIQELLDDEVTDELYEISVDAVAEALVRARRGIKR